MTDAEIAWLTLLRDKGPQSIGLLYKEYRGAIGCLEKGMTEWHGHPNSPERITPHGEAALSPVTTP